MNKKILSTIIRTQHFLVLIAFIVTYTVSYFYPVFIQGIEMKQIQSIPTIKPIGADFRETINMANNDKLIPYSPFVDLMFKPLGLLKPKINFLLVTFLTILSVTAIIITLINNYAYNQYILLLFLMPFLFSYPFNFEIERGQWNIISFCLAMIGVHNFNNNNKIYGIILITIAAHLKIFPILFFLLCISKHQTLLYNIKWIFIMFLINILLLNIQGIALLIDYFNALKDYSFNIYHFGIRNHSLMSFLYQRELTELRYFFMIFTGFILFSSFLFYYFNEKGTKPFNAPLFFILTILTLVMPSVSHDYKLSIFILAGMLYLSQFKHLISSKLAIANIITTSILIYLAYYSKEYFTINYLSSLFSNKFILIYFTLILFWIYTSISYLILKKENTNNS